MRYDIVAFLTDYGLDDGYVGICHVVMARIAPTVRIVDLTHTIPAQNVRRGAVLLAQQVQYLSPAVHLAVVDPGVGTARRGVVVAAGDSLLVGPDNGLLMAAADALGGPLRAHELTNPAYRRTEVSHTFHGRDVFAPAAAYLATGVDVSEFGDAIDATKLVRLPAPTLRVLPDRVLTEVMHIDRFGNVCTSARANDIAPLGIRVRIGEFTINRGDTFGSVKAGDPVIYVDSTDHVAIAINGGSATDTLHINDGDVIELVSVDSLG